MKFLILILTISFTAICEARADFVNLPIQKSWSDEWDSYRKNSVSCEVKLDALKTKVEALKWDFYSNEQILVESAKMRDLIWNMRTELHSELPKLSKVCVLKVRDIFHSLRDADDFLSEFTDHVTPLDPAKLDFQKQPVPIYDSKFYPGTRISGEKFEFRDGDIMLARGFSFLSAIISQVSDNRDHFSHTIVVSVKEKEVQTTESYVGVGVKNYEINYALKNENVRLMVLRPKDSKLGGLAASAALQVGRERRPYDYKMDFKDSGEMSCVEVPTYSYKTATHDEMKIPMYPAQLVLQSPEFLKRIGLQNGALITPDDLETDPRFDLILDWQDARLIRDSREKDAVLSEILRWLGELHYQFGESPKSYVAYYILWPLRQTFLWDLVAKIPGMPTLDTHIPRVTMDVMAVLDQTATLIQKRLKSDDETYVHDHGRPMTNSQLRADLEAFRVRDLADFRQGKGSVFHSYLAPHE